MSTPASTPFWRDWQIRLQQWWLRQKCPTEFLCDNCRYDYDSACNRRERPNAIKCPDYKPRT